MLSERHHRSRHNAFIHKTLHHIARTDISVKCHPDIPVLIDIRHPLIFHYDLRRQKPDLLIQAKLAIDIRIDGIHRKRLP